MNQIVLSVGGFYIQIIFKLENKFFYKHILERDIKKFYRNFITQERQEKYDFIINIVDKGIRSVDFVKAGTSNQIQTYINFFNRSKKNKITSYYYISINQFDYLFLHVLEKLLIKNKGFILQSVATIIKNKAILFLGGKESINAFIISHLSKQFPILLTDKNIIKKEANQFLMYQIPTLRSARLSILQSIGYTIKEIYLIRKSANYAVLPVRKKEAIANQLLKFSNVPKLLRHLELKQYSSNSLRYFFEFVNKNNFYSINIGGDKYKIKQLFNSIKIKQNSIN